MSHIATLQNKKPSSKFLRTEVSEFYNSMPKKIHALNFSRKILRNFWILQFYKKCAGGMNLPPGNSTK